MSYAAVQSPDTGLRVTYVTAPDCHLCERGRDVLAELHGRFSLAVREVDLRSVEGRQLVVRGRVPFPPAVFVDDRLVAHGRLSARALARELAAAKTLTDVVADETRG